MVQSREPVRLASISRAQDISGIFLQAGFHFLPQKRAFSYRFYLKIPLGRSHGARIELGPAGHQGGLNKVPGFVLYS